MSAQDLIPAEQAQYTEATYQEALAFVRTFMLNRYPDMDLQPTRAIYELLVKPQAELQAYAQTNAQLYRLSDSLQAIMENPDQFSEADVDRVLGNFLTSRSAGQTAGGNVEIVLSDDLVVSVPKGATFTANGLIFVAADTFISTSDTPTTPYDRQLTQLDSGEWSFTITVTAAETGSKYNLRQGTTVEWNVPAPGYVRSTAEGDFSGGTEQESNADYVARLDLGITAKVMGGRNNIAALIRDQFPSARDISIVGHGDSEMQRDANNLFGVKTGGKADIYVRVGATLIDQLLYRDCTLVDWATKTFQVFLNRDAYPGFAVVASVQPADATVAGSLSFTELRAVDTADLAYPAPSIDGIVQGAFSRFQTCSITFTDPTADVTNMSVGDTKSYRISLTGTPLIGDIQDLVSSRGICNPMADYLVRAPVPMLVAGSMQIDYVHGDQAVDVAAVSNAVADAINKLDFAYGRLSSSILIDAAHSVLTGRATVREPIEMVGVLLLPSGAHRSYRSSTGIDVPEITEESVSSRTVAFYTNASMIRVSTQTVRAKSV
jgi:hypothetical protein